MTQPMHTAPKDRPIRVRLSTGIETVAEWYRGGEIEGDPDPELDGWMVSTIPGMDLDFEIVGWVA